MIWPAIPDVESKTLKQAALWLMMWAAAQPITEVGGNNRGPWPDFFNTSVGLDPKGAYPWCTSSMYCAFKEAARQKNMVSPFPKTAKAVSVYTLAEPICRVVNPTPGCVGILDHGKAWASELGTGARLTDNGHCLMAIDPATGDVSGNTNGAGSREGDRFAVKLWPDGGDPSAVHGGVLLPCWLDFDLAAQPPPGFAA